MNVQGIYTEIINLPTKIYEKELELLTTFNKESQVKEFLTRYESARKIKISEEEDLDGKKIHTNAEKRQAELVKVLNESDDYQENKRILDGIEDKKSILKAELSYLRDQFSAYKSVVPLLVSIPGLTPNEVDEMSVLLS